jgi:hypothetical protein
MPLATTMSLLAPRPIEVSSGSVYYPRGHRRAGRLGRGVRVGRLHHVAALGVVGPALVVRRLVLELLAELGQRCAVVAHEAVAAIDPLGHRAEDLGGGRERAPIGLRPRRDPRVLGEHRDDVALGVAIDQPRAGADVDRDRRGLAVAGAVG